MKDADFQIMNTPNDVRPTMYLLAANLLIKGSITGCGQVKIDHSYSVCHAVEYVNLMIRYCLKALTV